MSGKQGVSEAQINLEAELKKENQVLHHETEKNRDLQEKVEKANSELTRLTKWNKSSETLNWLHKNHNRGKTGLGHRKPLPAWNPNSKYVGLPCNKLCFLCGMTGHIKNECSVAKDAVKKNEKSVLPYLG